MGEEAPPAVDIYPSSSSPPLPSQNKEKAWHSYISEDLPRTVQESTDSALRSARFIQYTSSTHLRTLQDFMPKIKAQYTTYEEVFFGKIKGPRRFLFRQTLGRLQSEEAKFSKAEKNVKELSLSVDLMKKESKKLLERAALAEKDMKRGLSDLISKVLEKLSTKLKLKLLMVQNEKHSSLRLTIQVHESMSFWIKLDLMDVLREIPGREALKLRAEVASMASHLRQQRTAIDKRIFKVSELGVPI